jgi:hypothetical protein
MRNFLEHLFSKEEVCLNSLDYITATICLPYSMDVLEGWLVCSYLKNK